MRKYTTNRMTDVLELIYTDICGPFPTTTRNGHVYFISFIDDYSRYGYIYLIKENTQALDTFKSFKSEVELQLNKRIKGVISDRGTVTLTAQESNVQGLLLNSWRIMGLCHNIQCRVHRQWRWCEA
jgi:Integrase core domain